MIELINTLKSAGIITAVASSKPQYFVIKILESLGVENIFDVVSGADGQYVDANKFRIIQNAMDKGGLKDKSKVLMVGDRRFDVIGSKTVGIKCAGVLFGYGSREELEQAGADYIVKDTVELKELILS
jgi:phosphoglycolate phosphatase